MSRTDLRLRTSRKSKWIFLIVTVVVIITGIIGAVFFLRAPISHHLESRRLGADVDEQVSFLIDNTPELFAEGLGNKSDEELKSAIITYLESKNLLVAEARARGIKDMTGQTDESLAALKAQFGNAEELSNYLTERGITERQLRNLLEANLIITALARDLVKESDITVEEAKAYFDANRANYVTQPSKRVSHILLASDDAEKAASLRNQIDGGADFSALAKQHSLDRSGAQGGDIGWEMAYPEAFQAAVDSLGVGQVSDPVSTTYGIHLIKITESREGTVSFEASKERVISDLLGKKRAKALDVLIIHLKGK